MRFILALVGVVLVAGGGYLGWREFGHKDTPPEAPPPVPVTTAEAKQADVPVYLRGIGTVRALNSVELHPQVTGVLLDVPVREGDLVQKGAVLAIIDPRPFQAALEKAEAQRQQDQAQLENAQSDLKRYSTLAQRDFASRQQVDTQTSSVARLTGVIGADDAEISTAKINLGYTVVRAPLDGRIGLRRVDPGNLVQANGTGSGILSVVQETPISVIFTLPEPQLPAVKAAMARGAVPVVADTSDTQKELAHGTLLTPDNVVDPASGSFQARAEFPNQDRALTPGQFVSVRVQVDVAHGVVVPHEAVQHGQDRLFVFTVKPDKTVERHDIQLAYDDGTQIVVTKGLANGDRVVVSGQSRVGPGIKVASRDTGDGKQGPSGNQGQ